MMRGSPVYSDKKFYVVLPIDKRGDTMREWYETPRRNMAFTWAHGVVRSDLVAYAEVHEKQVNTEGFNTLEKVWYVNKPWHVTVKEMVDKIRGVCEKLKRKWTEV